MSLDHLANLNVEQRRAVEHGVGGGPVHLGAPLLVIAGAGSGKTDTLAHRVANLLVNGVDPRRILLMTFSRRAASEMSRRVETISSKALGAKAGIMTEAILWAGTFHAIGARLLREYAEQIGLQPNFTIHDREDSADLMNLFRHQLGFSQTESRFPTKVTCLSIYSRAVNSELALGAVLQDHFPWCIAWETHLRELFAGYVEAKQAQGVLDYDDLLLYWAQIVGDPVLAAHIGDRFDHVLVDEYQDTNRLQSSILLRLKPGGAGLTVVGTTPRRFTRSGRRPSGTSSTSRPCSVRRPPLLHSTEITAPRSPFSPPPTESSAFRPNASPRISGRTANLTNCPNWSAFVTRPIRLAMSRNACWRTGRPVRN
jgi:DNA helicase II / ATP-dependent DNA helicase PcrA